MESYYNDRQEQRTSEKHKCHQVPWILLLRASLRHKQECWNILERQEGRLTVKSAKTLSQLTYLACNSRNTLSPILHGMQLTCLHPPCPTYNLASASSSRIVLLSEQGPIRSHGSSLLHKAAVAAWAIISSICCLASFKLWTTIYWECSLECLSYSNVPWARSLSQHNSLVTCSFLWYEL